MDQVEFLHADKQNFLKIITIVFGANGQTCSNYPK